MFPYDRPDLPDRPSRLKTCSDDRDDFMETRLYASQNAVTIRFRAKKSSFPGSKTLTALTDYPKFFIGMPVVQTDGSSVYGHVITKFSGMGRFTYPGCSAGARLARELRNKRSTKDTKTFSSQRTYMRMIPLSVLMLISTEPGTLIQVL